MLDELTISPDAVRHPIAALQVCRFGRCHDYMLHVPPREIRVGFEGQRANAGSQRGRGRRPRVVNRALVVQVRRHDLSTMEMNGDH